MARARDFYVTGLTFARRPTVRPAHLRYPQPHFVFPASPPNTAGLDTALKTRVATEHEETSDPRGSQWSVNPPATPSSPSAINFKPARKPSNPPSRLGHRRAMSDSTVQDVSITHDSDAGGFKVVISKPPAETKAKTAEDVPHTGSTPTLQVNIPSWKLGTPRFTLLGTPLIRGSSYAATEELPSPGLSVRNRSQKGDMNSLRPESLGTKRPNSIVIPTVRLPSPQMHSPSSPHFPGPSRATFMSAQLVISPDMFDALTMKPACDDRSIVRYSPVTGAVTAATPPRLVAEITSPTFLDYELLSDFFLTFRSFLESIDLLRMLIARLRWAVSRDDETGMIVRVRTFVAIRHWILNYFVDDFMVDYHLRITFCNQLNDFVDELSNDSRGRAVQLKILTELKKCWRRVCAQYWDGPEFEHNVGPDSLIAPGGIAGHRNPSLDPSFWDQDGDELYGFDFVREGPRGETIFRMDMDRGAAHGERPVTPRQDEGDHTEAFKRHAVSPTSTASLDVVSCSFPTKALRTADPLNTQPLRAHPVEASSIYNNIDPIAATPRTLTGKRVRAQPQQASHKRDISITNDLLREQGLTAEKVTFKNTEFLLSLPYGGSLVRGNLLPPVQAFVEVVPSMSRDTTIFQPRSPEVVKDKGGSAMSGAGMRKLISNVRRALSHRDHAPPSDNVLDVLDPIGPRGVTTNRIPGSAVVPQARRPSRPSRPKVRVDLLGAKVAEDFRQAVREDAEAVRQDLSARMPAELMEYSAAHLDSSFDLQREVGDRPFSDTGISQGSKSIVIVDCTAPPPIPAMTSALTALPVINPSIEEFADSFLPRGGADPTPPTTPPGETRADVPRRSSYILSQQLTESSIDDATIPPFIPDLATLGPKRPSEDTTLRSPLSIESEGNAKQPPGRPPLSSARYKGHIRQLSHRSYRSNHSAYTHRRWASITSAFPDSHEKSFDATTYSGGSASAAASIIMPPPLRVLRRRPGGDLRGVQKVTDLDALPLHRSRSAGSLTTYTESLRSSYVMSPGRHSGGFVDVVDVVDVVDDMDVVSSDYSYHQGGPFSLGALAEKSPNQQRASLFSTHSSKPIMRPSFELEAQKLAQIPDDVDDDGGVESALAKLEGRKYSIEQHATPVPVAADACPDSPTATAEFDPVTPEKKKHRHQHIGDETLGSPCSPTHPIPEEPATLAVPQSAVFSFLSDGSRDSYDSIPLLERGLTDDVRSRADTKQRSQQPAVQGADPLPSNDTSRGPSSVHASYEIVEKTASLRRIKTGDTAPTLREDQSFLDIESEGGSEISSELSAEVVNPDRRSFDPAVDTRPANPEPYRVEENNIKSPIMTLLQALRMSPESVYIPELRDAHVQEGNRPWPPTPETTPIIGTYRHAALTSNPPGSVPHADIHEQTARTIAVHLPFVLGFDSDILAQQFTLIEKDALNEIDWKELIDLRWKYNHTDCRSWVEFLRNSEARGVEVVVARFNIMVKWVISEIVLTKDDEERARCLIKFLHIAAHCRTYRNFATLSQITIALTSNEIARLTKTWAMVPPSDLKTMEELETLVSPTKNFYNLRAEMEGGARNTDVGCIPFVGIYTHDLLFNSQRPSEIASSPTTPPLVNFERCRIAASVAKTLLRLLEASAHYQFQPVEGITERCLWMSALTDEEIRELSETLEPAST